jgi:hypothetical protein
MGRVLEEATCDIIKWAVEGFIHNEEGQGDEREIWGKMSAQGKQERRRKMEA